jgi:hypothetical protein
VTSADAFANRNAPPTPWTILQRINEVGPVAKPAPSEASEKMTKPPTKEDLRPNRSDSLPALRSSTVDAIM